MKYIFKTVIRTIIGGVLYAGLELAFRGRTHWSMMITGGICFEILYTIGIYSHEKLWRKAVMGGACITAVEFVAGALVNIRLGWGVWDYSHMKFNLEGQICPVFTVLWTFLSLPVVALCPVIRDAAIRRKEEKGRRI